jgi:hypothetical protein
VAFNEESLCLRPRGGESRDSYFWARDNYFWGISGVFLATIVSGKLVG